MQAIIKDETKALNVLQILHTDMAETIVSLRVKKEIHDQMKLHDEINWSSILRNAIIKKLEEMEKIDTKRAKKAAKIMEEIRKKEIFSKGKLAEEIIREWRNKRK